MRSLKEYRETAASQWSAGTDEKFVDAHMIVEHIDSLKRSCTRDASDIHCENQWRDAESARINADIWRCTLVGNGIVERQ